jgi:hypothetical protein
MGSIRCPICNERLMGKDESSLSGEFRNHLVTTHQMKLPKQVIGKGDLAYGASPTIEGEKVEGTYGVEKHGKGHLEERKKKGTLGPQENIKVRCPIDGALFVGVDEDEVSALIKAHLKSEHS